MYDWITWSKGKGGIGWLVSKVFFPILFFFI